MLILDWNTSRHDRCVYGLSHGVGETAANSQLRICIDQVMGAGACAYGAAVGNVVSPLSLF